jgi:hypothetical protein
MNVPSRWQSLLRSVVSSLAAVSLALVILAVAAGFSFAPIDARPAPPQTRILFLGNSYTYFNNLPGILVKLAAARGKKVDVLMHAPGGWRLKDHWEKGNGRAALREQRWDFVVLQDQSTLGTNFYVDGKPRVSSDEMFRPHADQWTAEVRKAGAVPIFYLTWARKASPQDQAALNSAYIRAAKASDARVAPVGTAWARVRREDPTIDLFLPDGSHPSPAGSYLAACTFYAALFNESPVGLPATIDGAPVNPETGVTETARPGLLVEISPEIARVLQDAAWDAWKDTARPGFFDVAPVAPPAPARLPTGLPLSPERLAGTWAGSFELYPASRTSMVLRLAHATTGWSGRLELKYHSADAADQSLDLGDVHVSERGISFENPAAWQGLVMRFRGVSPRAGVLQGMVEAARADAATPMHLLGSWELRRQ